MQKRGSRFSIHFRFLLLLTLLVEIVVSITFFKDSNILFTVYVVGISFAILFAVSNIRKVLNALKLPLIFVLIGFVTMLFSMIMGYATPSLKTIILSSAKLTALFLVIALGFQWISLREFRWVLKKLGLGKIGSLATVALAVMPVLMYLYSDAYIATLLKLGKNKVHKALKPIIIHAALLSRDYAQAIYLYGLPKTIQIDMKRFDVKELLLFLAISLIGLALQLLVP